MNCQARQYSDQMICGKCGLQWDMNDPEPPECGDARQPGVVEKVRRVIEDQRHGS